MRKFLYLLVFFTILEFGYSDTGCTRQDGCTKQEKAFILLDAAKDYITRANELNPKCIGEDMDLHCERGEQLSLFLGTATNLISDAKNVYQNDESNEITTLTSEVSPITRRNDCECLKQYPEKPVDCSEILQSGQNESGVYTIWPRSRTMWNRSVEVYCDMDTDGGGWTLIQRRGNFSTPKDYFAKLWAAYKDGFGNVKEEFWLGNENIHTITNQAHYAIRFDLADVNGDTGFAQYHTFYIEDEIYKYKLHIEGYAGTVGDGMELFNSQSFSTMDKDNDPIKQHCAYLFQSAWWFNSCGVSNPNGLNQPGEMGSKGIMWHKWKEYASLASVEIKLRPWKIPNY